MSDLGLNINVNTNNSNPQDLPANFQLVPFDDGEDDDFLLEYLRRNPDDSVDNGPKVTETRTTATTNTMNSMSTSMPIIPRMYFPNSNVTINYNFGK